MQSSKQKKILASLGLLILTVVIVGALVGPTLHDKKIVSKPPVATAPKVPVPTDAASGNTSGFKNGTYMATGKYGSPGGPEKLYVTVTLVNGKVTASTLTSGSGDIVSASYQKAFIAGYKPYVNGKKITDIKVGAIGGSSLTTQGLSDALTQIEKQAQA